jgi:hypothetical protein
MAEKKSVIITYAEVEQVASGKRESPKVAWAHFTSNPARGDGHIREVVFQLAGDRNVHRFTPVKGRIQLERRKYVVVLQETWERVYR